MFKIYKASAGSGKTTHLVAEYLAICFTDIDKYRNILAITFTNNATAEMKERIISTLYHFAFTPDYAQLGSSDSAILQMVKENLSLPEDKANDFIRLRASRLLKEILYNYADFSISTIDAFFQRLIRAFAIDMDLNMNFNLEIKMDALYAQTIDLLINKISKADNEQEFSLSRQVLDLVEKTLEESGKSNLERELSAMLNYIHSEEAYIPLKEIETIEPKALHFYAHQLNQERKELKNKILQSAKAGADLIRRTGLEMDDFYQKGRGIYSWFEKVNPDDTIPSSTNVLKGIEKGCFTQKSGMISEELHGMLIACFEQVTKLLKQYKLKKAFSGNLHSLLLAFELKQIINEIKLLDNLFYLSESNAKIYDCIKDEEVPYIYEKLGNKYSYFLIDEFQDTSNMQWQNLLPLIKNTLSGLNQHQELGKNILFGDVKQAIYRFRNGDASLFNTLSSPEGYQKAMEKTKIDDGEFEEKPLQINYRSSQPIIAFNNQFFSFLKTITNKENPIFPLAEDYYRDVEQAFPPNSTKDGFVTIRFKGENESAEFMDEQVLFAVKDAIERGFSYKDIAILTKGKEVGRHYGRMLVAHQIPVISSDSLLLASSEEVRVIIAVMHYLLDNEDYLSKLLILNYLRKRDNDEEAFATLIPQIQQENSFAQLLKDYKIELNRQTLLALPLYTLAKEIIRIFDFEEANSFVISFMDVLMDYSSSKNSELFYFLDWWKKSSEELNITTPNDINAVTTTTIHKAKGLQYPVVIFPLSQYNYKKTKEKIWHKNEETDTGIPYYLLNINSLKETPIEELYTEESNKSQQDNLNILYVAHTRPSECFYIITSRNKPGNYGVYLDNFITNHDSLFVQDKEDDSRFWMGNKDYLHSKTKMLEKNGSISKIHTSDFVPDRANLLMPKEGYTSPEIETGIVIHEFFSSLHYFPQTAEEMQALTANMQEEQAKRVLKTWSTIREDDKILPYFSEGATVLNELSIIDEEGNAYRPDRVAILNDEVMVFDYKTGVSNQKDDKQLDNYLSLIRKMGYEKVNGRLLYI